MKTRVVTIGQTECVETFGKEVVSRYDLPSKTFSTYGGYAIPCKNLEDAHYVQGLIETGQFQNLHRHFAVFSYPETDSLSTWGFS